MWTVPSCPEWQQTTPVSTCLDQVQVALTFGKRLTLIFQCIPLYLGNPGTYANKATRYSYIQGFPKLAFPAGVFGVYMGFQTSLFQGSPAPTMGLPG